MAAQHSLKVTNSSTRFQTVIVYQRALDLGVPGALPLVWLSAPAYPDATTTFTWTEDYDFVWAQTGRLVPGAVFRSGQTLPADAEDPQANHTLFAYESGAYSFFAGPAPVVPQAGSLAIHVQSSVPASAVSVGIGMSGAAVFAVGAVPNLDYLFRPQPSYWLAAGTFSEGEALAADGIAGAQEIRFQDTLARSAVLGPDNRWTVS